MPNLTVSRLAVLRLHRVETEDRRDGMSARETANFLRALQSINTLFHAVFVMDLGPKKLKQLQLEREGDAYFRPSTDAFVASGRCLTGQFQLRTDLCHGTAGPAQCSRVPSLQDQSPSPRTEEAGL